MTLDSSTPSLAAVDLFCGVGGKTHGFIKAGVPVILGIDNDSTCQFAYERNNPGTKFLCKDIARISSDEIAAWYPRNGLRVLIGCAPCQPFSTYSYRYRTQNTAHRRWHLLTKFGKIVSEIQPDIVSIENVPTLARPQHLVFKRFIQTLTNIGYHVNCEIVRCADYGVPQSRERLVLLASRLGPISLMPPTYSVNNYVTVAQSIGSLPPIEAGASPVDGDRLHQSCGLSALNLRRIRATPEGGGWQDWPKSLRLACHQRSSGKTYPSVYGRMKWDDLAPTITTQCYGLGNGRFGHPQQDRAISLREAALLQTFPADYQFAPEGAPILFKHIGRHIGNAVPVSLGTAIGLSIIEHVRQIF